jgi:hypothetical protein
MLKVHETTTATGTLAEVYLRLEGNELLMVDSEEALGVPEGALDAVMMRYGAPLDPVERITVMGALVLGPGHAIRRVRHLSGYDVIARDYLIYEAPGREPLCALATTVVGALAHLCRAARFKESP